MMIMTLGELARRYISGRPASELLESPAGAGPMLTPAFSTQRGRSYELRCATAARYGATAERLAPSACRAHAARRGDGEIFSYACRSATERGRHTESPRPLISPIVPTRSSKFPDGPHASHIPAE
jgi:hypothetical protein